MARSFLSILARGFVKGILFVLLLFPVINVAGQSSFTSYVGATREYHIDDQPNITNYLWEVFTNASLTSPAAPGDVTITSLGAGREHEIEVTWNTAGTFYLRISVIDNTGCTNRMAWEFNITANQPPALADDSNATIETLSVDENDGSGNLLSNDVDPEGGTLLVSSINGDVSGTIAGTYGILIWNTDGSYTYAPNAELDSLAATETVVETFSVTVIDDQGLSANSFLTITISGENDLLVLSNDTNATIEIVAIDETDGSGNLLANDTDPDGDILSIISINSDVTGNVSGTYGILVWNADGTYNYSPNIGLDSLALGENVIEVFNVTVSDGNGGTAISSLTITISGENDQPTLADDTNNTIKSAPIDETDGSGGLLSNDVDIDGDLLQVLSIDGDLSGTVTNTYGVLEWNTDGTYTFTPNALLDTLAQGESVVITYNYTAIDGNGGSSVASLTITILGANSNPLALDDTNSTIETTPVDETDGSGNLLANDSDPELDPLHVESIDGDFSGTIVGIYGTLEWNTDGTYTYTPNSELDSLYLGEVVTEVFNVTISDVYGGTDVSDLTITLTGDNEQPLANDDWNSTIETSPVTQLTGSGNLLDNDIDVDGDVLTITSIDSDVTGTVIGTYGTLSWNADGTYTYTPNPDLDSLGAGESVIEDFQITINDGHSGTDISVLTITINGANQLPIAGNDTNSTVETLSVNQADGSGNILLNDTDADGDQLTISSVNGSSAVSTQGTYGWLTWNPNGTYTYAPNSGLDSLTASEVVTEIFTIVVSDGNGGTTTSTLTITINGENDVPVVIADTNSTIETNPVDETDGSGNLLANDSDPDGDILTIVSINGDLTGTTIGTYGTLTWLLDGTYIFTPNSALDSLSAGEVVTEIFNVTVSDGNGITVVTTLTITINGENNWPVLTDDSNTTVETIVIDETDGSGNILSNDTDPEGDNLTVISVDGNSAGIVSGTYGSLVWNSDGTYTYTPNTELDSLSAGENITEIFTFTISDGNGGVVTSNLTISIMGENDPPILVDDYNSTVGNDPVGETSGSGNLLANDNDPENDPLTITAIGGNTTGTTIGTYGTLSWNSNGTYTYTPNAEMDSLSAGEIVTEFFTVTVSDGNGGVTTSTLTINVSGTIINHAPVANADYLTINEDASGQLINVLVNDSDPDGDALSISIVSWPTSGGTVSFASGMILYNPPANFNGNDMFIYEICDNGAPVLCDIDTVFIVVNPVNDAPVAETDEVAILVNPENPISIDVQANDFDVDGDELITTIVSGPTSGGTVGIVGGEMVTYLPPVNFIGTDTIIYQICDNGTPVYCDVDTIFIRVVDDLLAIDDHYDIYAGETDTFNIIGNDLFIGNIDISLLDQPDHGTVTLNDDGTIQFIADDDYVGYDTLVYQISNGTTSDTAIVIILIKPYVNLEVGANCEGELAQIEWQVKLRGIVASSIDIRIYDANNDLLQFINNTTLTGSVPWPGVSLDQNGYALTAGPNLHQLRLTAEYNINPFDEIGSGSVNFPNCHTNVVVAVYDTATITRPVQTIDVLHNDYDPDEGDINPATLAIYRDDSIQGPYHGVVNVNPNGTITYIPTIRFSGIDSFAYIICDDVAPNTACDTAIVRLTVIWDDKLIAYNDNYWTYENTPKILPVTFNDFDPDNSLDWGSLTILTPCSNGTAHRNNNGTVTYTPADGFIGRDSFYYQICNTRIPPECDEAWVYIDVVKNLQIIATHDEVTTGAEESTKILVLNNDLDPEGLIDTLSLAIIDSPEHGTITILPDGTIDYQPANDFAGIDSFIYQICDSGFPRTCDTAVVHINILDNNLALIANPDNGITTENQSVEISLFVNDFDPDGVIDQQTLAITVQPLNGTLTLLPGGIASYQPESGFFGTDSFIYQICDNGPIVKCDTALVIIRVVDNLPPVAMNDTISIFGGTVTSWEVVPNDYDPENELDSTSVEIVTNPTNGTVTVDGTGSLQYTPGNCFFGYDTLTYQVYDQFGNVSNVAAVIIHVTINPAFDSDNDGASDLTEDLNANGTPCDDDTDEDLIPNYLDTDDDDDGVLSNVEDWNDNGNPSDDDTDNDGIANYLDADDDDDSILTINEDANGNGNYLDDDTDTDTIINLLDPDDDGDGMLTIDEVGDLDGNGIPDYLEVWLTAAVDDYVPIGLEEEVTIPVLENDSSQMVGSSLYIIQNPEHGFATIDQNDYTIIYSPETNYSGLDSFIYAVCDYYNICDTATVILDISDVLTFPQLFTPNGDGKNDFYVIGGIEKYPNNQFIVFNRWGNKVYDKVGYINDWDGFANVRFVIGSKELPEGVYYYILRFNGDKERSGALFLGR
jgi:gliding motility-associated-like protein